MGIEGMAIGMGGERRREGDGGGEDKVRSCGAVLEASLVGGAVGGAGLGSSG